MPTLKPGTILPTPEEDKEIRKAAATDPDAKLLEDPNIKLVSFSELKKNKKMGRPTKADPKIDIRMRSDIVEKTNISTILLC
ncbi:hypothetical protein ACRBEF_14705 [Yersinia proxima]|uniref:hypothetical protein n=2 Tax=Yersinia proxima TaxID=2890316 RepID=UPI00098566A9|nr:hypothetical protein [Yersinia proxima]